MSQQVKKYRLIKEYPGSPELGTINEYTPKFLSQYPEYWEEVIEYPIGTKAYDSQTDCTYTKQKDGWYVDSKTAFTDKIIQLAKHIYIMDKEVIEKEYEILSYYGGKPGHSVYKLTDCKKGFTPYHKHLDVIYDKFTLEYMKNNKDWFIHSIKRLSDGVVFTIGDKVRIKKLQCDGSFIISEFYFDCNNDKLLCNGKCTGNGHVSINKIEKVKQPIFTSTDGFEVFDGDKYYVAQTSGNNLIGSLIEFIVDKQILHNPEYYDKFPDIKRFAKEENCRQYIVDNMKKPLFTSTDNVEMFKGDTYWQLHFPYKWCTTSDIVELHIDYIDVLKSKLLFSTKAKAEEYILYNKPCLSLNDVLNISEDYVKATRTTPRRFRKSNMTKKYKTRKLIQLTQTKLKL